MDQLVCIDHSYNDEEFTKYIGRPGTPTAKKNASLFFRDKTLYFKDKELEDHIKSMFLEECTQPSNIGQYKVDDKLDNSKSDNLAVDKQTKYYVQVGIFNDIKKVKTLLTNANYQIDISSVTLKGKKYNNVRVFGFDSHDDAKKAANEISSLLDLKAIVQKLSK